MRTLLKISPVLLLASCAFDDSALNSKTACRADTDCTSGACIDGACEDFVLDATDAGSDAGSDTLPDSTPDATGICDLLNECGGCEALTGFTGDPCPSACGELECSADGESLECNDSPSNPCGGCEALEAPPGLACSDCGNWECDGPELVVCIGPGTNDCGGCVSLEETLGAPCGACGGDWMCDGVESLTCVGAETNACGGCEAPLEVAVGDVCACGGPTAPSWSCDDESVVCGDQNDSIASADSLGAISDSSGTVISARGSLHTAEDADYYSIRVIDSDDLVDGLFPVVTIADVPDDRQICAFWLYDDRRMWDLQCASSSVLTVFEGNQACCTGGGPDSQIALMQDIAAFERLDNILAPETADGMLYTAVVAFDSDSAPACEPYHLQFTF